MRTFEEDMEWSESILHNEVWPAIKRCVGGEMVSVEAEKTSLARRLDISAGIDALIQYERGIKSLASRIQRTSPKKPFATFTIRAKRRSGADTEFAKRVRAIFHGDGMYPAYTLHAYVSEDERFLSAAIIKTEQLYRYIYSPNSIVNYEDKYDEHFLYIYWDHIGEWIRSEKIQNSMSIYTLKQMALNL